ncbi:COP9 signalosome subunit 6 [Raphidocelis subcapitata]|uniref:COP9 signalosome subunit 6 n=1 Tax=Raphidocelis subcapitata TaxID=307507 RepID=A0A2V0PR21_9CHLO|nr:COP9 signalosome subunit 6 [Raphidocelis subcapitata]|eukprot:GBF99695.1 COP9 signalosome subunit 6 [Raphidocelis subcapitata]
MEEGTGRQSSSGLEFKLHPLVMINVSDHHTRVKANAPPGAAAAPVMGCLLGSQSGRTVDINNSFEIDYTLQDGRVVINEAFLTRKQEQYKQVFPKVDVLGWYVTGAAVEDTHMQIHKRIAEINEAPVLLLLNPAVTPGRRDLPLELYETELHVTGDRGAHFSFVRANFAVETSDAERIAVDQVAKILPGGKATGSEQLTAHLMGLHSAIKMLQQQLVTLQQLMARVNSGEVAYPHALARQINALVHSLPALTTPGFTHDYLLEHNDALAGLYLATLTRSVAALNDTVDRLVFAYEPGFKAGGGGGGRRRGGGGGGALLTGRACSRRPPLAVTDRSAAAGPLSVARPRRAARAGVALQRCRAAPGPPPRGSTAATAEGSVTALQAAEAAALTTAVLLQVATLLAARGGATTRPPGFAQQAAAKQQQRQQQQQQQQRQPMVFTQQLESLAACLQPPSAHTLPTLSGLALAVALSCGALLRRIQVDRLLPRGQPTADAAVRLVRVEAALQQQAVAASQAARQLDKLQTRARLSASDVKLPLRQLQDAAAGQADALGRLAEQQVRLQQQVAGVEEVIGALQGVGARQFKVCVDALTAVKQEQAAAAARHTEQLVQTQAQVARLQQALAELRARPLLDLHAVGGNGNGRTGGNGAAGGTPADPWRAPAP